MGDPFRRLRVVTPPSEEICSCSGEPPIKLSWALSPNPLHCLDCNLEVDPARLPLPAELVDPVADFCNVAGAVGILELDSGPYEAWARNELLDLASAMNQRGFAVRKQLNCVRRCYLGIFQPEQEGDSVDAQPCPVCSRPLASYERGTFPQLVCDHCSVVVAGMCEGFDIADPSGPDLL